MKEHVNDFCYWIDEANLNSIFLPQKMSAMFLQEITSGLEWTEWSSSSNGDKKERGMFLKGMV